MNKEKLGSRLMELSGKSLEEAIQEVEIVSKHSTEEETLKRWKVFILFLNKYKNDLK